MAESFGVRLEGVREVARAIGHVDPDLRRELGRRNKAIGQNIIDRAYPKPERVGAGTGAKPRASAKSSVLLIRAGGRHRDGHAPVAEWGARFVPRTTKRPFIARSAEQQMPQIQREYLDALRDVSDKAGIKFKLE